MKSTLLILVLCCMFSKSYSQFSNYTFSDVTREELLMKDCPFEPGASAMIIAEKGGVVQSVMDPFTEVSLKRRIKIFKKEGLKQGTIEIEFNRNRTDLEITRATAYNLINDQVVIERMSPLNYLKTSIDKNILKYTINLSGIKEGSVIDIFYKLTSYNVMEIVPWYFQSDIPCGWSEYNTIIHKKSTYNYYYTDYLPFVINTIKNADQNTDKEPGYIVNRFAVENAPSFHLNEPFLLRPQDQLSKIELVYKAFNQNSIWGYSEGPLSWSGIRENLLKDSRMGKVVNRGGFLKNPLKRLFKDCTTYEDSLNLVYEYIRQNVKSNGYRSVYANDIEKVMYDKSGNTGEINLLLIAALREAGFDSHPLLLATNEVAPPSKSDPRRNGINYLVAIVFRDTSYYLLDASKREIAFNTLPLKCLNGEGFLVSDHFHKQWIPLLRDERFETADKVYLSWDPEKEVTVYVEKSSSNLSANSLRYINLEEGEEGYIKSRKEEYQGYNITTPQYTGLIKTDNPFIENFRFKLKASEYNSTESFFLQTVPFDPYTENPFDGLKRDFNIDFLAPTIKNTDVTIKIPEGYSVVSIPESITDRVLNNDLVFEFSVTQNADLKEIYIHSGIQIKRSSFSKNDYNDLRQFFAGIVKMQNTLIELKKN